MNGQQGLKLYRDHDLPVKKGTMDTKDNGNALKCDHVFQYWKRFRDLGEARNVNG